MAIITISRGSYSKGKDIAEAVADRLGYECLSRDVLLEASEHFNVPEVKLVRALHDAPNVLQRFTHGKANYVAYIQMAFLEKVQKDDVVYHGLAGHFFVRDIPHVLKVRIIADFEDRVEIEMAREDISEEKARHILLKDDEERRRWGLALYGIDTADPSLYDLVIHVRKLEIPDAVDMIVDTARLPQFQTTPESQKALDELLMAARARSTIIKRWPDSHVTAHDGVVYVHVEAILRQEAQVVGDITKRILEVPGVTDVRVSVSPITLMTAL